MDLCIVLKGLCGTSLVFQGLLTILRRVGLIFHFGIRETLTQVYGAGTEQVMVYISRKLNNSKHEYTANERELLAVLDGLKQFRCYLEENNFEVLTDLQVKAVKIHVLPHPLSILSHAPTVY